MIIIKKNGGGIEIAKRAKNVEVDWGMKISACIWIAGTIILFLAEKANPVDFQGMFFGTYASQWGAAPFFLFLVFVFLSDRGWGISWLRIIPYISGFILLALGLPGALSGEYKTGDYVDYVWVGDPETISRMAEAYHLEIVVLATVCALYLVGVYLRRR